MDKTDVAAGVAVYGTIFGILGLCFSPLIKDAVDEHKEKKWNKEHWVCDSQTEDNISSVIRSELIHGKCSKNLITEIAKSYCRNVKKKFREYSDVNRVIMDIALPFINNEEDVDEQNRVFKVAKKITDLVCDASLQFS